VRRAARAAVPRYSLNRRVPADRYPRPSYVILCNVELIFISGSSETFQTLAGIYAQTMFVGNLL
jgi:hypothetical protein